MTADSGTAGSSHPSQLFESAPIGAEDPTVVRAPVATGTQASTRSMEGSNAFSPAPVADSGASVSATLKRIFSPEESVFGLRLAEFVLEEKIGSGGMGAVFKAQDTRLSRKVALKVLSPRATLDTQLVSRFHNEARATARLSHDNIARVYSSGETLGVHYIAYELIDGTNLKDFITERGVVKADEALSFAIQIGMALNHTAAAGVVHRDIKPSNIIITPAGRARVVDLGLARRDSDDSVADLTVAGATLGTFDYISPEQAQDPRRVDVRSDIYSLGCTMFHMLTGQPPYPEGTALQKLLDHKGKDAPAPIEVNKKVPRDLSAVVHRMMASDPAERHAAPALLVEDLMRVAARMGLRGIQPEGLVWKRASETRPPFLQANLGWITMGALLLLGTMILRVQPHVQESDSLVSRLNATQPAAATDVADRSNGTAKQLADSERGIDAIIAVLETALFAGEPAAETTEMVDGAWSIANSLGSVSSQFAEAFKSGFKLTPDEIAILAEQNSTTDNAMVRSANGPAIFLQADPGKPFPTLQAACWAAKTGDVIVVRPDKNNSVLVEKPLRIVKKNITIRGEMETGSVPLIRFDVGPEPADVESKMITVAGGDVRIANLDIQVVTRDDVGADRWVLCALDGADRVRLDKVNIDFLNPANLDAAMFEVTLGDEAAMARMQNAVGEYEVRITGGTVRGNCRCFHIETALSGSLEITNAAVYLSEPLLYVAGINDELLDRDRIDIELTHTTCVLGGGLIRMSNIDAVGGPAQQLLPLAVVTENNIFATMVEEPLVRMEGTSDPEEFRSLLSWTGQKNLYDGFNIFWELDSSRAALGIDEYTFADWRSLWAETSETGEVGAISNVDPWRSVRWREQEISSLQLSDLELDESDSTNEAISTATDGTNLGADLENLRRLPVVDPEDE
jgi:serine/threonine-protein kinase